MMEIKLLTTAYPNGRVFWAGLLLILAAFTASAQEFRGLVAGKITDPNGAVVPGNIDYTNAISPNVVFDIRVSLNRLKGAKLQALLHERIKRQHLQDDRCGATRHELPGGRVATSRNDS